MTKVPALDPFVVFGIEHRLDLDPRALERRYLELSRDSHPDLHRAHGVEDCAAVLSRAAEINDAWRLLENRWSRAEALLALRSPGELERQKQLDPAFLLEAMDLAEAVATLPPAALPALQQRLQQQADEVFAAIARALAAGDHAAAARRLHESRYVRKALADLDQRLHGGPEA